MRRKALRLKTINGQSIIGTSDITISGGPGGTAWEDITGKPSTFPPEGHTHSYEPANGNIQTRDNSRDNLFKWIYFSS